MVELCPHDGVVNTSTQDVVVTANLGTEYAVYVMRSVTRG
jgi:hypothetical protein